MARRKTSKRPVKRSSASYGKAVFAYPLIIFLLLCVGVYLVSWSWRAGADNILVTARVPGVPVTAPAVITTPSDGDRFTAIPIEVDGTCPANAAYVEIFRNNLMSGSALCSGGGTFQLFVDLFPGQNSLVAHVFNVTDDEGPVSAPVTVYYDVPPAPPGSSSGSANAPSAGGSGSTASVAPLSLKTAFVYKGYYTGQKVEWPLEINGGTRPYALNVDWGDGHNDVISRGSEGEFKISHTYSRPGSYRGSYTVKIKASDSQGQTAYLQFFLIVNSRQDSGLAASIFSKPPPSLGNNDHWLLVAWPAYAFVLIMGFSYWLGEHEELMVLRKRGRLRRT